MSVLNIVLFGPPRAERDGVPLRFQRGQTLALLAYLAAANRPHSRDALAALFWPQQDEQQSHAALRRSLYDLGRIIGKDWLTLEDHRVALPARPGLAVDVRRFGVLTAPVAGHGHAAPQLCDDCLAALAEAAGLYRDDFLAGFTLKGSAEFDTWQTFTTEILRLELAEALEKLAGALLACSQIEPALPHARRWLALDPLHEASHRLLMQLHAAAGDRAALARQYRQCVDLLAAELGVEPALETSALYYALLHSDPAPPAEIAASRDPSVHAIEQPAPSLPPVHLPADATPFVGREAELRQVAQRLADPACRLLTVLGPGGIGKTRLAVQAARSQTDRFAHGVHFVDLASLSSADLLSTALLHALHAPPPAGVKLDDYLLDFLRDKQMLLVLDNYEHLLSGPEPDRRDGYGLVTKIAATAPQLKLLVTSRARINVSQEYLAPLEGLATPPLSSPPLAQAADLTIFLTQDLTDGAVAPASGAASAVGRRRAAGAAVAALNSYSATALFLNCVRRLHPAFQPTAADARAIAHICRLLEGTPLAIELAAAWTRVLPLAEIARDLEQGMSLLTSTLRSAPPRQLSMVAALDHSWRLLAPAERSMLRQLSVFRGGFTREAAQAVAGTHLRDLASLADASWLRLGRAGHYAIHELSRQYCAERLEDEHLAEAGESANQVRQRHAGYYQSLLVERWEDFFRRQGAIAETTPDVPNLLAAWDWALRHDDLSMVWALSNGLGFMADRRGENQSIARVFEIGLGRLRADQAAARGGPAQQRLRAAVLVALLANQCERFCRVGQIEDAQACLAEAEALLGDGATDHVRWAEARWFYGRMTAWLRFERGDFDGLMQLYRALQAELLSQHVQIWPYSPDTTTIWLVETYELLEFNALSLGDYEEVRRLAAEGIAIAEQQRLPYCRAWVSYPLCWALLNLGEYPQAEQAAERFLSAARAFADDLMITQAMAVLGQTQLATGQHDRARATLRRALALARRSGLPGIATSCLAGLGLVELDLGHLLAAQRWYRACCPAVESPARAAAPPAALVGLGRVALGQGRPAEALEFLRQALAVQHRNAAVTAAAIVYTAEALLRQDELARPAELCGFLLRWSGAPHHVKRAAQELLAEVTLRLPAEDLAAAVMLGEGQSLREIVAQSTGP
jgi:predicted ATPase/DNA-binding SARP family transcriptional activator